LFLILQFVYTFSPPPPSAHSASPPPGPGSRPHSPVPCSGPPDAPRGVVPPPVSPTQPAGGGGWRVVCLWCCGVGATNEPARQKGFVGPNVRPGGGSRISCPQSRWPSAGAVLRFSSRTRWPMGHKLAAILTSLADNLSSERMQERDRSRTSLGVESFSGNHLVCGDSWRGGFCAAGPSWQGFVYLFFFFFSMLACALRSVAGVLELGLADERGKRG